MVRTNSFVALLQLQYDVTPFKDQRRDRPSPDEV